MPLHVEGGRPPHPAPLPPASTKVTPGRTTKPLDALKPPLGLDAQQAAEDAIGVLARADERIGTRGGYLNHLLIRSESISSSWIEGNSISPKKLAIAELLEGNPAAHSTRVALDVVANVRATEEAIRALADRDRGATTTDFEDLQHIIEPRLERGLRTVQNWVGGPGWSPLRADFVPPPASEVPRLVDDLARFVTATDGNPVVRAAIAHAQFETIHPFIDGNGRTGLTGRAIIHTVLKRADALRHTLIPISTVFAGNKDTYIGGLTAYRADPSRLDEWVVSFARAAELAAGNAVRLSEDIEALDASIFEELITFRRLNQLSPATPRRDAVSLRILEHLTTEPVLTIDTVSRKYEVSSAAAQRALTQLADARVLSRNKDQKGRLVCWTADRHLALVGLTERSNRVGAGDTAHQKPARGPAASSVDQVGVLHR
jgi:Fic family protein